MNDVIIRHASVNDAEEIALIHCQSWRDAYSDILDPAFLAGPIEEDRRTLWFKRLEDRDHSQIVLIAGTEGKRSAGFVCAYRDFDPTWGSLIDNIHVLPEMRGKRLGEQLMRAAAQSIAPHAATDGLHLWVFSANAAGLRFYLRLGGEVVGHDTSPLPAARGATVFRVFWPRLSSLLS